MNIHDTISCHCRKTTQIKIVFNRKKNIKILQSKNLKILNFNFSFYSRLGVFSCKFIMFLNQKVFKSFPNKRCIHTLTFVSLYVQSITPNVFILTLFDLQWPSYTVMNISSKSAEIKGCSVSEDSAECFQFDGSRKNKELYDNNIINSRCFICALFELFQRFFP